MKGSAMKERFMTVVISVTVTYLLIAATSEPQRIRELDVDRLIVRKELIVSDTGQPWEANYEQQQMPRGIYARALVDGRTRPPSTLAIYDCDVFMRRANSACERPAAVRASISTRTSSNSSPSAS